MSECEEHEVEEGSGEVAGSSLPSNAPSALPLWKRLLIFLFGPLLLICNVFWLATVCLHNRLQVCFLCPPNVHIVSNFIYLSIWCLWTGTATFALWAVSCYKPNKKTVDKWMRRFFNVSLPWTATITTAYSVYLVQGGAEFDDDACYVVWQAMFPRDSSAAAAYTYIGFGLVQNICMHFLLFVVHAILYITGSIPYGQIWPFGLLMFVTLGVVVGFVQGSGLAIYCVDSIWQTLGIQWALYVVLHFAFFFGYSKCSQKKREENG